MKLGIVMLAVADMNRSVAFYRDTLGLTAKGSGAEFSFFDAGGVTLSLRTTQDLKPSGDERRVELVFNVEDITAAYEQLKSRGCSFRLEPREATGNQLVADFRDPDGHVLSIFGPRG